MPVIINFKICDNCDACNAIGVCPTKAFCWNENKKTLEIKEEKCVECGLCATSEESCQVGAIRFAKTQAELEKVKKEIENDNRTIADLMVDRYGGQPINMPFYCKETEIEKVLSTQKLCMIEFFKEDYIECLIKSIPIKDIVNIIDKDILYRKLEVFSDEFLKKYNIQKLPSLLFFKNGNLLGKVEGYFTNDEKDELIKKINEII